MKIGSSAKKLFLKWNTETKPESSLTRQAAHHSAKRTGNCEEKHIQTKFYSQFCKRRRERVGLIFWRKRNRLSVKCALCWPETDWANSSPDTCSPPWARSAQIHDPETIWNSLRSKGKGARFQATMRRARCVCNARCNVSKSYFYNPVKAILFQRLQVCFCLSISVCFLRIYLPWATTLNHVCYLFGNKDIC